MNGLNEKNKNLNLLVQGLNFYEEKCDKTLKILYIFVIFNRYMNILS